MNTFTMTFEQFSSVMLAAGYDQVTTRVWDANIKLDEHTHPFDANAIVVQGDMVLGVEGRKPIKLAAGDTFHLKANTPHYEEYGSQGATFWVARKGEIPAT